MRLTPRQEEVLRRWGRHTFRGAFENRNNRMVAAGWCVRCGYPATHPVHHTDQPTKESK